MTRFATHFAPPLALMGLIFFLSAQEQLATDLGAIDLVLRKLAHMAEYALLFLLWLRALGHAPAAVAIAFFYACTDEFHQTFVDGRHGTPVDVLIDSAGIALAWLAVRRAAPRTSTGTPHRG